jgi:threonyl-tRNA synthetase
MNTSPADHPVSLDILRHDAAHILAQAVTELFPGTRTAIGPAIENGFYYDFQRDTPFTVDDLPRIEARKVPFLLITGKREAEQRTISVRRLGGENSETLALESLFSVLPGRARPPG